MVINPSYILHLISILNSSICIIVKKNLKKYKMTNLEKKLMHLYSHSEKKNEIEFIQFV